MGLCGAGDCRLGGQACAARPAAADLRARDRLPARHFAAFRGHFDQSHLQELLGPAAPGGGDAVRRRSAIRAVVGSARRLRAKLFIFLRRRRHRILDLRARGAGAAGLAAAGLCRCDRVRCCHQHAADGVRRAFLYRRRDGGIGDVCGDLARLRLHLPLAPHPAHRREHRCRADAAGMAGVPSAAALARPRRRIDVLRPEGLRGTPFRL